MKKMYFYVLAILCMCGCSGVGSKQEAPLRTVETVMPVPADGQSVSVYAGRVKENNLVQVAFKTGGQISRIHVKQGDMVRKGQLLAELDTADYALGVRAYQVQYDQLKEEVARIRTLYERNSVSRNDYEKAEAGLQQLEVALQSNINRMSYTRLYAPADGEITSVNAREAELIDAGMPLFALLQNGELQVLLDVPQKEYLSRHSVSRIVCRTNVSGDEWRMHVQSLTPKADNNQLYKMLLAFADKPGKQITPGMNIDVLIAHQSDSAAAWLVPLRAVREQQGQAYVLVMGADSVLYSRPVQTGDVTSDGRIEVIEGLSGSERVVRTGARTLMPGEKVQPLQPNSPTNIGHQL